jgi:lipoprotein-releasing system permease protein
MRVFLIQGAVVALAGSLLGSALARIILFGWQAFARNADGTPLFPVELGMDLVVMAAVLATLVGLLAAIMPALRAARLDPVVAIRG